MWVVAAKLPEETSPEPITDSFQPLPAQSSDRKRASGDYDEIAEVVAAVRGTYSHHYDEIPDDQLDENKVPPYQQLDENTRDQPHPYTPNPLGTIAEEDDTGYLKPCEEPREPNKLDPYDTVEPADVDVPVITVRPGYLSLYSDNDEEHDRSDNNDKETSDVFLIDYLIE